MPINSTPLRLQNESKHSVISISALADTKTAEPKEGQPEMKWKQPSLKVGQPERK